MGETETTRGATRKNPAESQVLPNGRKIFVGFGVHDYEHFQKLKNPKKDIEALGALLQQDFGFNEIYLYSSKEETTHSSIKSKIRMIPESLNLQSNDTLILFLAGHGYLEDNTVYFTGSNSPTHDSSYMLDKDTMIKSVFPRLQCFHLIVMLDFCYAGGFYEIQDLTSDDFQKKITQENNDFYRIESIQSRRLITSGSQYERVKDDAGGHSPFVKSLINNLISFPHHEFDFYSLASGVLSNLGNQSTVVISELAGSNHGQFIFRRQLEIPTSAELKEAFLQLNFKEQIEKISTPTPFNLIYVQGTPSCAHHLFAQRYFKERKKKEIRVLDLVPYRIRLGVRESQDNLHDLWQLLNSHFIRAAETISPEEIVEIIWEKIKQSNHVIFFTVEDNSYNLKEMLNTFWRNWYEIVAKKNYQKPPHYNNFFMFILDRRGKEIPLLEDDLLSLNTDLTNLVIFPPICPLTPKEIEYWLALSKEDIKAKAFQNLAVDHIVLEEYYIQETILNIAERCNCKKSYDEIFLKQWA